MEAKDAEKSVIEDEQKRKLDQEKELKGRLDQVMHIRIPTSGNYDIAELFSPPRMTNLAKEHGLKGGWPIDDRCTDPITGRTYELRNSKDQNEVRQMIKRDKPLTLTVFPPCTMFSITNQWAS